MKEFSKSDLELLKDLLSKLIKAKEKNDYFLGLFHKNFISDNGYYWKEGKIDPRIKFIKKLIKKSS